MTDLSEVRLVRTDGDSWDITESVGATALGVAAARAAETARADALIRDDYAYLLTAAAGPAWAQMASGDDQWLSDDEHALRLHEMARDYQAVRTHYFDGCPATPRTGSSIWSPSTARRAARSRSRRSTCTRRSTPRKSARLDGSAPRSCASAWGWTSTWTP
jgi:Leucine carboxyl methyltransferase